jgi:hypothetical protein
MFMPLEFSAAAYRFGHSMVRNTYNYNLNFNNLTAATLEQLFNATRFRGEFDQFDHIPEKWIIQWENFLDGGANRARRIDTRIVNPLARLPQMPGLSRMRIRNLAVRNLLRGYLLRIPTGQTVAKALSVSVMSEEEIARAAANDDQLNVLSKNDFLKRTPLWFYILAEASDRNELGPVGSTIIAEVLIGLIRWTENSILSQPGWMPSLGPEPGRFTLTDFFRFAGVWR